MSLHLTPDTDTLAEKKTANLVKFNEWGSVIFTHCFLPTQSAK